MWPRHHILYAKIPMIPIIICGVEAAYGKTRNAHGEVDETNNLREILRLAQDD